MAKRQKRIEKVGMCPTFLANILLEHHNTLTRIQVDYLFENARLDGRYMGWNSFTEALGRKSQSLFSECAQYVFTVFVFQCLTGL
jgi:hypothetical protein